MADQPEPLAVAPNMPATSIDFDKFHAAVTEGKAPAEAIATADLTPPAEAEVAESGVTHFDSTGEVAVSELPTLAGKTKAELLAIADDETVEIADGATNAEIVAAIEAARLPVAPSPAEAA